MRSGKRFEGYLCTISCTFWSPHVQSNVRFIRGTLLILYMYKKSLQNMYMYKKQPNLV